jgi:hypothetical protein
MILTIARSLVYIALWIPKSASLHDDEGEVKSVCGCTNIYNFPFVTSEAEL